MGFLNFLFRSKSSNANASAQPRDSRRRDRSGAGSDEGPQTQPAQSQQSERAERREMLYGVVRETMMRGGVLSASYKFKVLSLDVRGRQFLVMMDLAPDAVQSARYSEFETQMGQAAKARYDIAVASVYWRINKQIPKVTHTPTPVSATKPQAAQAAAAMAPVASRAPLAPPPASDDVPGFAATQIPSAPAPLRSALAPMAVPEPLEIPVDERTTEPAALVIMDRPGFGKPLSRYEPIEDDEVAAFKKALASAGRGGPPASGVLLRSGRRNPAPIGFEDTQPPEEDERERQGLSATQYGEMN